MSLFQQFRLGNDIESLALRLDTHGTPYSQMTDITDIFPGALRFKVDGINILFLENEPGQRYEPRRIAYYPGVIIDVVTASSVRSPPPYLTADSNVDGSFSSLSLPSYVSETSQANTPHLVSHSAMPRQGQAVSKTKEKQMPLDYVEKKSTEGKKDEKQGEHSSRPLVVQYRTVSSYLQRYELPEWHIPRMFVVLPEPFENCDTNNLSVNDFRLYFLCDCDHHCYTNAAISASISSGSPTFATASPLTPIAAKKCIHVVRREGYELLLPTEFLDHYGLYVLGLLRILKKRWELDAIAAPVSDPAEDEAKGAVHGVLPVTEKTLEAVDMSIAFLEKTLERVALVDETVKVGVYTQADDVFTAITFMEGADLRRLKTFLREEDTDKPFSNMNRIITETGQVKWVCLYHYRQVYPETALSLFLQSVVNNGGNYDLQLGKVTVSLKSSAAAKNFFSRLSTQAPAITALKVTLDWPFKPADLVLMVDKVTQSNIRDFELDLQEYLGAVPLVSMMRPGKGRYHSLLGLFSNDKIRRLTFSHVALIGPRTSKFPVGHRQTLLQSFRYFGIIYTSDETRLIEIIYLCPWLVDLRLGWLEFCSQDLVKLDRAISSLSKLETLYRYYLHSRPLSISKFSNDAAPYGSRALKELVDYGLPYPTGPAGLLEDAIGRSSSTLGVLMLLPSAISNPPILDLAALCNPLSPSVPAGPPFLARLTHLELLVNMTSDSLALMASLLPSLRLIHFGVNELTSGLLDKVNFTFLRSLRVSDAADSFLGSFYERVLSSPRSCQIHTLRFRIAIRSQSLLDVLGVLPLRRIFLKNITNNNLTEILQWLNFSQLKVLTVHGDDYNWDAEAVLAGRSAEFADEFVMQLTKEDKQYKLDVHNEDSRSVEGSSRRLARRYVHVAYFADLDCEYCSSVLPLI
ncbi:hypothetical protein BGZ90_009538 [Linnemannia elongata]|nr:hypothetical protein BGZ90_009538 [Linnemannia elongata]